MRNNLQHIEARSQAIQGLPVLSKSQPFRPVDVRVRLCGSGQGFSHIPRRWRKAGHRRERHHRSDGGTQGIQPVESQPLMEPNVVSGLESDPALLDLSPARVPFFQLGKRLPPGL
jgi:hypothetical protein